MFIRMDKDFNIRADGMFSVRCEVHKTKGNIVTVKVDRGIYYDVNSSHLLETSDLPLPPGECPWRADPTGQSWVGHNM